MLGRPRACADDSLTQRDLQEPQHVDQVLQGSLLNANTLIPNISPVMRTTGTGVVSSMSLCIKYLTLLVWEQGLLLVGVRPGCDSVLDFRSTCTLLYTVVTLKYMFLVSSWPESSKLKL